LKAGFAHFQTPGLAPDLLCLSSHPEIALPALSWGFIYVITHNTYTRAPSLAPITAKNAFCSRG